MKRKIATIMAADVVGYSRMIAEDEEDTLRRLISYRGVFSDLVGASGGRIFNTAGDAVFAEFPSAVDAMRAAIEIQESIRTRNLAYPESRHMRFRIGMTIGDVVERDGDLLGDGVNVAARLEGLAEPGGICLSRGLHEQVTNKMSLVFRDIGPQSVKNIPTPIHAYVIAAASSQLGVAGGRTKVAAQGRKLLAVLAGASGIVVAIGLSLFATGTMHADRPAASPMTGAQSVAPLPPAGVPAPTQATAIDVPPVDLMAAAETDAEACDRLAMAPFDGRGGRKTSGVEVAIIDPSESVPVCRKALDASPNDARLAMELARSLEKQGGADAEALALYRRSASLGDGAAHNALGLAYWMGRLGLERSADDAVREYRLGVDAGDPNAMRNMSDMYNWGHGLPHDSTLANEYRKRAIDAGLRW